jgi:ADP-ribosylglycohydrolase
MFRQWAQNTNSGPYNSFGNGSAMRISPVGFAFDNLEEVLEKAKLYSEITHNHPAGIKGAQATASAIFLARNGSSKKEIRGYIESNFAYDLSRTLDDIRPHYRFDATCQGSVPEAIIAFLESEDYEDAIRNAVSLGGDSDTQACITGGIAEAFYGNVPEHIERRVLKILDDPLRSVTLQFMQRYVRKKIS